IYDLTYVILYTYLIAMIYGSITTGTLQNEQDTGSKEDQIPTYHSRKEQELRNQKTEDGEKNVSGNCDACLFCSYLPDPPGYPDL
ncbi:MAG TPA: hypothetical protein VN373_00175, partial [Methanosarcina barkeri]|nr:hypothetical protein [Methanosarcina barkeri]